MSGIDLSAAVEAAAAALDGRCGRCLRPLATEGDWTKYDDDEGDHLCWYENDGSCCREPVATPAALVMVAAAPLIERAVREKVAAEIESRVDPSHPVYGYRDGITYAARIARGDS